MRREDRPAYPPRATQEALANAICHRDYTADGVALAAIQGLNQKLTAKESEIAELRQQNIQLENRLAAMEGIVAEMASRRLAAP